MQAEAEASGGEGEGMIPSNPSFLYALPPELLDMIPADPPPGERPADDEDGGNPWAGGVPFGAIDLSGVGPLDRSFFNVALKVT